jgi:hypothetical protein
MMEKSFILALIVLLGMIVSIRCQSWPGTYTVGSTCNTTACCCFTGQITITGYNSTNLYITSGANGTCNATYVNGTFNANVTANNYSISTNLGGQGYSLSLSSDNRIITATINITTSICNVNATKNQAIRLIHDYSIRWWWWWCFATMMIII